MRTTRIRRRKQGVKSGIRGTRGGHPYYYLVGIPVEIASRIPEDSEFVVQAVEEGILLRRVEERTIPSDASWLEPEQPKKRKQSKRQAARPLPGIQVVEEEA